MPKDTSTAALIHTDPAVCHGQPVFVGTRILVSDILELLAAGVEPKELLSPKYFPQLTLHHIRAALQYAADQFTHREFVRFPNR